MHRRKQESGTRAPRCRRYLLAVLAGFFVVLLCLFACSVVMTVLDAPRWCISLMSAASLCIGCFAAGYAAAKRRRRHGLRTGLVSGLLTCGAVFLLGVWFLQRLCSLSTVPRLLLAVFCGAVGGVLGVNSRLRGIVRDEGTHFL